MDNFKDEENLICETLVREIRGAARWSSRVEAWEALLSTRRAGDDLRREAEAARHLGGQVERQAPLPRAKLTKEER